MPRYYFHLTDGKHARFDLDGMDLQDDDAATTEANLEVSDMRNDPDGQRDWAEWLIQVSDETGRTVISLPIDTRWKINRFMSGLERRLMDFLRSVGRT